MLQAVLLFLVGIMLLGVFGRWRRPGRPRIGGRTGGNAVQPTEKCRVCGAYTIGADATPCARADCPRR